MSGGPRKAGPCSLSWTPAPIPSSPLQSRLPEPYVGGRRPQDHPSPKGDPKARVRAGGRASGVPSLCPDAISLGKLVCGLKGTR